MGHQIVLQPEDLRAIIQGKKAYRRCPDCQGQGRQWWIEYTLKERPHDSLFRDVTEQEAADFCLDNWPDYDGAEVGDEECENCNAVGYVSNEEL